MARHGVKKKLAQIQASRIVLITQRVRVAVMVGRSAEADGSHPKKKVPNMLKTEKLVLLARRSARNSRKYHYFTLERAEEKQQRCAERGQRAREHGDAHVTYGVSRADLARRSVG